MITDLLKGKEDNPILIYCTGGIRCEKAGVYLSQKGFRQVYSLDGGIVKYSRDIKEEGLECKFKGKNFSFDERLGDRVTSDILR